MPGAADVGNSANWQFAISETRSLIVGNIPKFSLPIQLDKQVIAARVDSVSARDTWYFAGNVFQEVRLGILVGGQPDAIASRQKIWLNQFHLFFLPKLSSSYVLSYKPPKWFQDATISVWEYTGLDPVTPDSDHAQIVQQLTEIESKINTLL